MPGRFPLAPVPLANDPFCEDGFCNDTNIGGFVPDLRQPTALNWVVYIRSILEIIEGNLLTATCTPPGPNPPLPSIITPVVLGDNPHRFQMISSSIGNYGTMRIDSNGYFRYEVDLENPIVRGLTLGGPVGPVVSDTFKFIMYDGSGDQSEGQIGVSILATYPRYAMGFTFDPFPGGEYNGQWRWFVALLGGSLAEPNTMFFGLNYPWSGYPSTLTLVGFTDGAGNWLLGGPPPVGPPPYGVSPVLPPIPPNDFDRYL
jgi:VCBS repeat-containing protein